MKILIIFVLILVSGCSNPTESRIERSKKNFDKAMNEVKLCLGKVTKGMSQSTEVVISKSSQILNIQVESSILGNSPVYC